MSYEEKLTKLETLSYHELCVLKQECIHRQGFKGLKQIEEAIAAADKC